MNLEEEDMFIIATGRHLIKRKRCKECKNSRNIDLHLSGQNRGYTIDHLLILFL